MQRLAKLGGRQFGAHIGGRDDTSDQDRGLTQTPRQHGESSSNVSPANLETVTDREKRQELIKELDAEIDFVSKEQSPHQCAMQTDILEIMQPDILGMKLTSMPVTFMDMEGGDNTTNSSDETLVSTIKNMSRASPRDTKNKSPPATRKWKKKE